MDTHNEEQDINQNSAYNPFPEPQTIPSGWDLSALLHPSDLDPAFDQDDEAGA